MSEYDPAAERGVLARIRAAVENGAVRFTQHAQQEMAEEEILLDEVLAVLRRGQILENYPQHRRGSCCLVCGYTGERRPLHLVCTTPRPRVIVITVYEPRPPKWVTPIRRRPAT